MLLCCYQYDTLRNIIHALTKYCAKKISRSACLRAYSFLGQQNSNVFLLYSYCDTLVRLINVFTKWFAARTLRKSVRHLPRLLAALCPSLWVYAFCFYIPLPPLPLFPRVSLVLPWRHPSRSRVFYTWLYFLVKDTGQFTAACSSTFRLKYCLFSSTIPPPT